MRLQIASDLHLEFPQNERFMKLNPLKAEGDILLLAGDIVPLRDMERYRDFFDRIADNYNQTYWVPGNHEYYNLDIADRSGTFQESIRSNITLLNNSTIEQENVRLHFTSLWSNISEPSALNIVRGLMDFHLIKYKGGRLSVELYNRMHSESVAFLRNTFDDDRGVRKADKKNIIISHHVPTFRNYPAQYIDSPLNEAFATDLDLLIEASGADYWLYGHHHTATSDFLIGNTRLMTNQLGYVSRNEHTAFDTGKVISLD